MLETLITSKTRLRLLIKFFISQANHGYLNGLASEMGESTNSIRKELNRLFDAGYLVKLKKNNKVEYKANTNHPMFEILQKVVFKHLGLEDIVDHVLAQMGDVMEIHLISDYAKGLDTGLIEVLLIGDKLNADYINNLEEKIEKLIERKVQFIISNRKATDQKSILLYQR